MNFQELTEWLNTTIPGIIILGTIGSLLAGAVLWLLSRFTPLFTAVGRGIRHLHRRLLFLTRRFSHRRRVLDDAFLKDTIRHRNSVGLMLFLCVRLLRCLCAIGFVFWAVSYIRVRWTTIHLASEVMTLRPTPLSGVLFCIVGIEFAAILLLFDFGTLATAYLALVTRPIDRLKRQHSVEIAWTPPPDNHDA